MTSAEQPHVVRHAVLWKADPKQVGEGVLPEEGIGNRRQFLFFKDEGRWLIILIMRLGIAKFLQVSTRDGDVWSYNSNMFKRAASPLEVESTTTQSVSATQQHEQERPRRVGAKASPRPSIASDSRVSTH